MNGPSLNAVKLQPVGRKPKLPKLARLEENVVYGTQDSRTPNVIIPEENTGTTTEKRAYLIDEASSRGRANSAGDMFSFSMHDTALSFVEMARIQKNTLRLKGNSYAIKGLNFQQKKYIYIPSAYLSSPNFNLREVFTWIGLPLPSIVFRFNQTNDPVNWNPKLPSQFSFLQGMKSVPTDTEVLKQDRKKFGPLRHYQGVMRENCHRLLKGACQSFAEAGVVFRANESWSSDAKIDAVGTWLTSNDKHAVPVIGIAQNSDYHPEVWEALSRGATFDSADITKMDSDVVIDPTPFYDELYEVTRDPITHRVVGSFPHPNITHLLISDNRALLEQKIKEAIPWGVILINGSKAAGDLFVDAVQEGMPVVVFKHTGFTADIVCEMVQRANEFLHNKQRNVLAEPTRPFRNDMTAGYQCSGWLKPFDEDHLRQCEQMNVLLCNLPGRFCSNSVYVLDMFKTSDDEIQDQITQTMGVAFEGESELGGAVAENRRLTYAWRTRQLFRHNALIFLRYSDVLNYLVVLFTALSTISAVLHIFVETEDYSFGGYSDFIRVASLRGNLILPLVATITRGVISVLNPMMKYISLEGAAVRTESEIYLYRCKVGKYNSRLVSMDGSAVNQDSEIGTISSARQAFASVLDNIWQDINSSEVSSSSLAAPSNPASAVDDINKLLRKNRKVQKMYTKLLKIHVEKTRGGYCCVSLFGSDKSDIYRKARKNQAVSPEDTDGGFLSFDSGPRDDGLAALSAEEYVRLRMIPIIAELMYRSPSIASSYAFLTMSVIILSVSASALSVFGYSVLIPALLAVSGAIAAWGSYKQTDIKLHAINGTIAQLNQLIVWWDGLTMIEKRVPYNKEILVKSSETLILAFFTPLGGSSHDNKNADMSSGNNEEGAG